MKLSRKDEDETETETEESHTYLSAHGTVMIIAWIVFASTAIIFARYGRKVRFGSKDKILGEAIWFQLHRILACLTTIATLLGFFFILVQTGATWVESDEGLQFVHSVLGGIIVACALVQAWMALFRCHPESSFRFIFNWLHRITGSLAFFLSIPTIFTIAVYMDMNKSGMIVILSLWSVWIVAIVVVLEYLRFTNKRSQPTVNAQANDNELHDFHQGPSSEQKENNIDNSSRLNKITLLLFFAHVIVSLALSIPLIYLVW